MADVEKDFEGSDSLGEDLISTQVLSRMHHVYLDGPIKEPSEYRSVFNLLRNASFNDVILFHLNTDGGYITSTLKFYNEMKNTNASTVAMVSEVCSAGTMISLFCDEIEFEDFSSFMIHSASYGQYGKHNENVSYNDYHKKYYDKFFKKIYKGFLKDDEIDSVLKGTDIWLSKEQCEKRVKNRKKIRERD
jgi:ATP-dependent protease ClpP protease subunit